MMVVRVAITAANVAETAARLLGRDDGPAFGAMILSLAIFFQAHVSGPLVFLAVRTMRS